MCFLKNVSLFFGFLYSTAFNLSRSDYVPGVVRVLLGGGPRVSARPAGVLLPHLGGSTDPSQPNNSVQQPHSLSDYSTKTVSSDLCFVVRTWVKQCSELLFGLRSLLVNDLLWVGNRIANLNFIWQTQSHLRVTRPKVTFVFNPGFLHSLLPRATYLKANKSICGMWHVDLYHQGLALERAYFQIPAPLPIWKNISGRWDFTHYLTSSRLGK